MSVERARRYYLLKRLEAARRYDGALASAWAGKQEGEPGTALAEDFPYRSRLVAVGYSAIEDLDGATTEELEQSGFTSREASAVIAAAT
jgi:hypothetical protein